MDWIFNRNSGARVSDKLSYRDWKVVVLENERIRVVCIPGKGGDIVSFFHKDSGTECLISPVREFADTSYDPNCSTIEFQAGNCTWPEMFPVASSYGNYSGVDQPFHGEAHILPWRYDIIKDSEDEVSVKCSVRMQNSPFELIRTMSLKRGSLSIVFDEEVRNLSDQSLPIIWGHHPTFGKPLLSEDSQIYLPKGKLCDGDESMLKIQPEGSGIGNMFYLIEFTEGWYGLYNHRRNVGFGMRWDPKIFRTIWLWQAFNSSKGAPFFGRRYTAAIEPVSSLWQTKDEPKEPLPIMLGGNETLKTSLESFIFTDTKELSCHCEESSTKQSIS